MEININVSTINKYFSLVHEGTNTHQQNKYRTKIINFSYLSYNEINISNKISKIPYYSNYYSILHDYEELNISKLNDNIIEKLKNTQHIKYFLFKYNDNNAYDFTDYLYNFKSIKQLIFNIINIFSHILLGLNILNKNNICFFNISPANLIFLKDYREKPVLSDFTLSLQINKLDKLDNSYILQILNRVHNFTYQPFEIFILYYFFNNNMITISYSFIEEICEEYVKNLNILRFFSENYKKKYKENCIETMKKYINKSKNIIIDDILERNDKWDVYGISLLFLQIFGCIYRVFSLKDTFINRIIVVLSQNLHPNSDKRLSLEETLNEFTKILNEQEDWAFINKLDNSKLNKLFDDLSK
jgi:hypothetical protein